MNSSAWELFYKSGIMEAKNRNKKAVQGSRAFGDLGSIIKGKTIFMKGKKTK